MSRPDARALIAGALDAGTWVSWDSPPAEPESPGEDYATTLARAADRSGYDESVITGEGRLAGHRVAVMACEFSFLGGSIGVAAADRLVRAVERATREGLPLLAAPASGGTRMQEGAVAFLQMVKISDAVTRHKEAGLPYLVYLRDPTTGGVFASWGSLGHVTAAEPGALIGFLGPRVYEACHGEPFPEGVQVAENLHRRGLVDAVVAPRELRAVAGRVLDVLSQRPKATALATAAGEHGDEVEPWESVRRSRRPDRPGVRALLQVAGERVTPLHGTGAGESEAALLLAFAAFDSQPCVLVGQDRAVEPTSESEWPAGRERGGPRSARGGERDRRQGSSGHSLRPAGLRVARRGMTLAAELGLPLVTVVDTAGAEVSVAAEEGGLAGEIARCLADLVRLPVPTACVLLGQGAGGGALALFPTDRVIAAQHGWLSPLSPEGGSVVLHRTVERAGEVSAMQRISAADLRRDGVVDRVVPECPDAADEPEEFLERVGSTLADELGSLHGSDRDVRLARRHDRYRALTLP